MKKLSIFFLSLLFAATALSSCSDDDVKDVVDCFGQNLLIEINSFTDPNNSLHIDFKFSYYGEMALDNTVNWNFGDNTPVQTASSDIISHTYDQPGTYTVTLNVSLNNGQCDYDINKTITVQ
ncbi:PKD domain-containing protein [Moheibacter sediminis]|uniref:PKD domain-containing protein n=1 Tax=Moheibacter sediminis TaxID=1434700 RepID=A0A1W1YMZ6_9FLAO|nr:PKD domain-containing protein [Moheibacter sediminis]SMC37557.1 PKD domain-containing protein [Moheibacter sediminis]